MNIYEKYPCSNIIGEVRDYIVDRSGNVKRLDLGYNYICMPISLLFAGFLKGDVSVGITHVAFGFGNASWDTNGFPPPEPLREVLVQETFRKAIQPSDIQYVDSADSVVEYATNRLRIRVVIGYDEFEGTIRESGVIGNGTDEPNTGRLLNHKRQAPFNKTLANQLIREIYFTL